MQRNNLSFLSILFLWLYCLPSLDVSAASPLPLSQWQHRFWNQSHGLPHISVNTMAYGADGRLWLGTERGLASFDGIRFDTLYAADEPALQSDWINHLFLDQQQRLWVATLKNLAVLEQGQFKTVNPPTAGQVGNINGISQTGDQIWLAADRLFQVQDNKLHPYPDWQGSASALLADQDGLWVIGQGSGADNELWYLPAGSLAEQPTTALKYPLPPEMRKLRFIALAKTGDTLWLASNHGLFNFSAGVFSRQPFAQTDQNVLSIAADQQELLVSFKDVFYRLGPEQIVETIKVGEPAFPVFSRTLLVDKNGFWSGSQTDGLRYSWRSHARVVGLSAGLSNSMLWSVFAEQDRLLIGSQDGVAIWQQQQAQPFIGSADLPNPMVYNIFSDSKGRIWAGTRSGLACFSAQGQWLFQVNGLEEAQINGMIEDQTGQLWVVSTKGVFQLQQNQALPMTSLGFSPERFRVIAKGHDQSLWFGSDHGLYQLRGTSVSKVDHPILQQAMITAVAAFGNGQLAVGTYEQGLFVLDAHGWQHYPGAPQLPSQTIFSLLAHQDDLLLSTPEGAFRLSQASLQRNDQAQPEIALEVLLYDPGQRYGRQTLRCCNGAGTGKSAVQNGLAFFPSTQGLTIIDLTSVPPQAPTSLIYRYQTGQLRSTYQGPATLALGERALRVDFGAIAFTDGDLLQFRYRLVGQPHQWRELAQTGSIYLDDVKPGVLQLEIQARRPLGAWGPPAQLALTVPPYFHETKFAKGLFVIGILLLLAALWFWREHRHQRQKTALETLVKLRTAELTAANSALLHASNTDPLTGLSNRRFIQAQLEKLQAQLNRQQPQTQSMGLLLLDIDHFKQVNDQHGHAAGDAVLRAVAAVLQQQVRENEYAVRWGGEEFLLLLPQIDPTEFTQVAQRIRLAVAATPCEPRVTVSVGIALWPNPLPELSYQWQQALEVADYALYQAKLSGRNCCVQLSFQSAATAHWDGRVDCTVLEQWQSAGLLEVHVLR